jgi:hypothetical protein
MSTLELVYHFDTNFGSRTIASALSCSAKESTPASILDLGCVTVQVVSAVSRGKYELHCGSQ